MSAIDTRVTAHIPTSAEINARFVPLTLAPLRRLQLAQQTNEMVAKELTSRLNAIVAEHPGVELGEKARIQTVDEEVELINAQLAELRRQLPDTIALHEAEAAAFGEPPIFIFRTPTSMDRERRNSRLAEMGLNFVGQEQIRASMIEALFEIDWKAEEAPGHEDAAFSNEAYAEEMAAFLDGIWQREDIQMQAFDRWREQEQERQLDIMAGGKVTSAAPMPVRIISVRDEARGRLLADRLMETPRMGKVLGKKLDFGRRNAVLIARISLLGVEGMDVAIAADPLSRAVPEDQVNALRQALEDRYGAKVAADAWVEIVAHADRLYSLDEYEAGNFDSPLAKQFGQTGSTEASGDTSTSGGSSTASSIEPAPEGGSATTTDKSSGSTSEAKDRKSSASQTVEA